MASMKRPRLKDVQPRSGASLELTFTNGQHFTLDMTDALKTCPGLAPLSKRKAFEGVVLGDWGWSVLLVTSAFVTPIVTRGIAAKPCAT
ncbi:hypothetical protein [Pseudomonas sp. CM25]|uniref:hypothetical protein n=1 Tax=Pseudomonas sp. CM25 TaxID=2738448 RepID=UPI002114BE48|nr:hypothetical protein [Pseudomonas sp. CM25]